MAQGSEGRFDRPVVLFDFDGTLADTGPAVKRAAEYTLRTHGFSLDAVGDLQLLIGPPIVDGFMEVAHLTREEAEGLVETYRAAFAQMTRPEDYPVFPGMAELVAALSAAGRTVGVATSRLQDSAEQMISSLPLPSFDAIVGRIDGVRHTKEACVRACLKRSAPRPAMPCSWATGASMSRARMRWGCRASASTATRTPALNSSDAGADALCTDAAALAALLGCALTA